jgi:hypothetical protein
MSELDEALRLVDRAIGILEPEGGASLASAYGTRGQILHDAARHGEAVLWLQRSYAERQKSPNPDLAAMIENLELEAKSFAALGDDTKARAAEERLLGVRNAKEAAPHSKLALPEADKVEGSVLIELNFGRNALTRYAVRDVRVVADQLSAILDVRKLGFYGGGVVIPESTTLIFHGPNAEEMFGAMQQFLSDHLIFAGATVTVRQETELRSIVVSPVVN